jgi:hypothetical protein
VFRYDAEITKGAGGASSATTSTTASAGGGGAVASSASAGGGLVTCSGQKKDKCGSECVDLESDIKHCGFCNMGCTGNRICNNGLCIVPPTCKELLKGRPGTKNGIQQLDPDGAENPIMPFGAYCEMESDGGGWTLLMKIAGKSSFFSYYNANWTTSSTFNPTFNDLDEKEAKLQGCFSIPFTELRLGLKEDNMTANWIVVQFTSPSLCDLFKANMHFQSSFGEDKWRKLIGPQKTSMCSVEGFNISDAARLGFTAKASTPCNVTPYDDTIGFGFNGSITAGRITNIIANQSPAFGYIMGR